MQAENKQNEMVEETAVLMERLQDYVPFLQEMISNLSNDMPQHSKIVALLGMISDKKKKYKYETLVKCEDVILKMKQKTAKKKEEEATKRRPLTTILSSIIVANANSSTPAQNSSPAVDCWKDEATKPISTQITERRSPNFEDYDGPISPASDADSLIEVDRYVREAPSIYSIAAESISKSAQKQVIPIIPPPLQLLDKPPISQSDLEQLRDEISAKIKSENEKLETTRKENSLDLLKPTSKVSLVPAPINNSRFCMRMLKEQRERDERIIDLTLEISPNKIDRKIDREDTTHRSNHKKVEKIVKDADSTFGNLLSSIDTQILSSTKRRESVDKKKLPDSTSVEKTTAEKEKNKVDSSDDAGKPKRIAHKYNPKPKKTPEKIGVVDLLIRAVNTDKDKKGTGSPDQEVVSADTNVRRDPRLKSGENRAPSENYSPNYNNYQPPQARNFPFPGSTQYPSASYNNVQYAPVVPVKPFNPFEPIAPTNNEYDFPTTNYNNYESPMANFDAPQPQPNYNIPNIPQNVYYNNNNNNAFRNEPTTYKSWRTEREHRDPRLANRAPYKQRDFEQPRNFQPPKPDVPEKAPSLHKRDDKTGFHRKSRFDDKKFSHRSKSSSKYKPSRAKSPVDKFVSPLDKLYNCQNEIRKVELPKLPSFKIPKKPKEPPVTNTFNDEIWQDENLDTWDNDPMSDDNSIDGFESTNSDELKKKQKDVTITTTTTSKKKKKRIIIESDSDDTSSDFSQDKSNRSEAGKDKKDGRKTQNKSEEEEIWEDEVPEVPEEDKSTTRKGGKSKETVNKKQNVQKKNEIYISDDSEEEVSLKSIKDDILKEKDSSSSSEPSTSQLKPPEEPPLQKVTGKEDILKLLAKLKEKEKDEPIYGVVGLLVDYIQNNVERNEVAVSPATVAPTPPPVPPSPPPKKPLKRGRKPMAKKKAARKAKPIEDEEEDVEVEELAVETVGERIKNRRRNDKPAAVVHKKRMNELEKLHENIKETIGDDILATLTKRGCTLKEDESTSSAPPPIRKDDILVDKARSLRVILQKLPARALRKRRIQQSSESDTSPKKTADGDSETSVEPAKEDVESEIVPQEEGSPVKSKGKRKGKKSWAAGIIKKKKKNNKTGETGSDRPASRASQASTPVTEADSEFISEVSDSQLELPQDYEYVPPDKNYYLAPHEINHCKLCNFAGKSIIHHYMMVHPKNDISISRLSPESTAEALAEAVEQGYADKTFNIVKSRKRNNFMCRFCLTSFYKQTPLNFYDHISSHTGELRYHCPFCSYRCVNMKNLRIHITCSHKTEEIETELKPERPPAQKSDIVFGYICSECNYLQLKKENVEEHMQIYHLNNTGFVHRINMSLPIKDDLDLDESSKPNRKRKLFDVKEPDEDEKSFDKKVIKKQEEDTIKREDDIKLCKDIKKSEESIKKSEEDIKKREEEDRNKEELNKKVFMCDADLRIDEVIQEGLRLERMNEIHDGLQKKRTSFVQTLKDRLDTAPCESPPPEVPEIDIQTRPIPKFRKISLKSTEQVVEVPVEKVDPISDTVTRLQDKLNEPPLPKLVRVDPVVVKPLKKISVTIIEAELQDDKEPVYVCNKACIFRTTVRKVFEAHCRLTHRNELSKMFCHLCEVKQSKDLTMLEIFSHLCEHVDKSLSGAEEENAVNTPISIPVPIVKMEPVTETNEEDESQPLFSLCKIVNVKSLAAMENPSDASIESTSVLNVDDTIKQPVIKALPPLVPISAPPRPLIKPVDINMLLNTSVKKLPKLAPKPPEVTACRIVPMNKEEVAKPRKTLSVYKAWLEPEINERLFKCPEETCYFTTNMEDMFSKHLDDHDFEDTLLPCTYCNFKMLSIYYKNHLLMRHADSIYGCPYCQYRAINSDYIQIHQEKEHPNKPTLTNRYPDPNYQTKLRCSSLPPMKNFFKPYVCKCQKKLYVISNFEKHALACPEMKPLLKCGLCKAVCRKMSGLIVHYRFHQVFRYNCRYCAFGGLTTSDVLSHIAIEHPYHKVNIVWRILKDINLDEEEGEQIFDNLVCFTESDTDKSVSKSKPVPQNTTSTSIFSNLSMANTVNTPTAEQAPPISLKLAVSNNIPPITATTGGSPNTTSQPSYVLLYPSSVPFVSAPATTTAISTSVTTSTAMPPLLLPASAFNNTTSITTTMPNLTSKSLPPLILNSTNLLKTSPVLINESQKSDIPSNKTDELKSLPIKDKPDELKSLPVNDKLQKPLLKSLQIEETEVSNNKSKESDINEDVEDDIPKKMNLIGNELYVCAMCKTGVDDATLFKVHLNTCTVEKVPTNKQGKPYACAHCEKSFRSIVTLIEHIRVHSAAQIHCSLCDFVHKNRWYVRNHMRSKHNITNCTIEPADPAKKNVDKDVFIARVGSSRNRTFESPKESPQQPEVTIPAPKMYFTPDEVEQLPMKPIYAYHVFCKICNFATKVRMNLVRHMAQHANNVEQVIPVVGPINPVPCLEKNELMFDKMTNLAMSSHVGGRMGGMKIERSDNSATIPNAPQYIPSTKRYVCGAKSCDYLCLQETMFRHHLQALHDHEKNYTCTHCEQDLTEDNKTFINVENIINHLRLHEENLYKCAYCDFLNTTKLKIEKHCSDKHPDKPIKTVVVRENVQDDLKKKNDRPWRCGICPSRGFATVEDAIEHARTKHVLTSRYKCFYCDFKSEVQSKIDEHLAAQHTDFPYNIIIAYYSESEVAMKQPVQPPQEEQFDTTPLWLKNKMLVKHIRGILLDEQEKVTKKSPIKAGDKRDIGDSSGIKKPGKRGRKKSILPKVIPSSDHIGGFTSTPKLNIKKNVVPLSSNNPHPLVSIELTATNHFSTDPKSATNNVNITARKTSKSDTISELHEDDEVDIINQGLIQDASTNKEMMREEILNMNIEQLISGNYMGIFGPYGKPNKDKFLCPLCANYETKKVKFFENHLNKELHNHRFGCTICKWKSPNYAKMRKHFLLVHGHSEEGQVDILSPDSQIDVWIKNVLLFQQRIMKHHLDQNSISTEEGSSTKNETLIENIHIEESPKKKKKDGEEEGATYHTCACCNYKTKIKSDLKNHEMRHFGLRPFKCGYCEYSAVKRCEITGHSRRVHPTNPTKILEIPVETVQDVVVANVSAMKTSSHICRICSMQFMDAGGLRRHETDAHQLGPTTWPLKATARKSTGTRPLKVQTNKGNSEFYSIYGRTTPLSDAEMGRIYVQVPVKNKSLTMNINQLSKFFNLFPKLELVDCCPNISSNETTTDDL